MNWYENREAEISELLGKTIFDISGAVKGNDFIRITTTDGKNYIMQHHQNCCENVSIEDIIGDVDDLLNSPLTMAEESTNEPGPYAGYDSYTWTFYKFATIKGYVTVRWLGESNGYYSERVDFEEIVQNN